MLENLQKEFAQYNIKLIGELEYNDLYELELSNHTYNQMCQGRDMTLEECIEEVHDMPPGLNPKDKHFLGFYENDKLIAVMDLLTGWPNEDTYFIGLFMIHQEHHGKGIGSRIMRDFYSFAKKHVSIIRLGVIEENKSGLSFWKKEGFNEVERKILKSNEHRDWSVIVMEKKLSEQ